MTEGLFGEWAHLPTLPEIQQDALNSFDKNTLRLYNGRCDGIFRQSST
jgi:hypothetical protein